MKARDYYDFYELSILMEMALDLSFKPLNTKLTIKIKGLSVPLNQEAVQKVRQD